MIFVVVVTSMAFITVRFHKFASLISKSYGFGFIWVLDLGSVSCFGHFFKLFNFDNSVGMILNTFSKKISYYTSVTKAISFFS
jgi:hypothetical protein